jgi:hypothetical protein
MRFLRTALVAAALMAAIIVPNTASAQINSFQIGDGAQLGPEGATVAVPVIVNCSADFFGTAAVGVAQSTGKRLMRGDGQISFVCSGSDQTLSVTVFASEFPYKQGRASATAGLSVFDPVTFQQFNTERPPQEIRIRK